MPNHTHGILIIDKPVDNRTVDMPNVEMPNLGISTGCISTGLSTVDPQKPKPKNGGKIDEWKPGTIGVIVNQYKRMVTIHNRKINPNFAWQSNYHDHIIRNSKSFENIQNYIENNPAQWKEDRFC